MGRSKDGPIADIRKDLKIIKETQRRIISTLDGETIEKAAKYDALVRQLGALRFSVASVSKKFTENGDILLIVNYDKPHGEILITDDDVIWDPFSSAMNELNLITYDDMAKIAEAIENNLNK